MGPMLRDVAIQFGEFVTTVSLVPAAWNISARIIRHSRQENSSSSVEQPVAPLTQRSELTQPSESLTPTTRR